MKTLQATDWHEGVAVVWETWWFHGLIHLMEKIHTRVCDLLPADLKARCPPLPLQLLSSPD